MAKANKKTGEGAPQTHSLHFEQDMDNPPHHSQFIVGDDNWGLAETALPVTHPKVSSHPGDVVADSAAHEYYMEPCYNEKKSVYISDSRTDGKKG